MDQGAPSGPAQQAAQLTDLIRRLAEQNRVTTSSMAGLGPLPPLLRGLTGQLQSLTLVLEAQNQRLDQMVRAVENLVRGQAQARATDPAVDLARAQVEQLKQLRQVMALENRRARDEAKELRKAEERRLKQARIEALEARRANRGGGAEPKEELLIRTGELFGDLGALALGFMAFATSWKAMEKGASEALKRADAALQGFLAQIWATSKLVSGFFKGLALAIGVAVFAVLKPIEMAINLVKRLPYVGKLLAAPISMTLNAVIGMVRGLAGFFEILLAPVKIAVLALRSFARLSGLISVLLIAFDAVNAGWKEFKAGGDALSILGATIWGAAESIKNTIVGLWKMFRWVAVKIGAFFGVEEQVKAVFGVFEGFVASIWNWIDSMVHNIDQLPALLSGLMETIPAIIDGIAATFTGAIDRVFGWLQSTVIEPIIWLFDMLMKPHEMAWELLTNVADAAGDTISGFIRWFGDLLGFFDRLITDVKEGILKTNIPGFGTVGNLLKTNELLWDAGRDAVEGAINGQSQFLAPRVEPRKTLMGSTLEKARMEANRAKGGTVIVAPTTVQNNSSMSQSSMKQVIAMPMTPGNPREPATYRF